MHKIRDKAPLIYIAIFAFGSGVFFLSLPFWAWGTSTWTDKFSLEMPAQGDIGWDDAIRLNHKIFEVITGPILDGHLVVSGATPTDGGGLVISWSAGTIMFKGQSHSLAAGSTTFVDDTINFLSAVTDGAGGVTVDNRSTEYYPPSNASGYYTPLAIAFTEAGGIVRLKDVRFIPETRYSMDQNVDSGATPTFGKVYVIDQTDSAHLNARSGVTAPSGTSPTATALGANGQFAFDTNDKLLATIIDGTIYTVQLERTIQVPIMSPDLLDDPNQIPLFTNGGQTAYITGATFYASKSGVSIEGLVYTASEFNYQFGAGTTIFNFVNLSTSGTSVWYAAFSGLSEVPPSRTVLMDFGEETPAWIKAEFRVRYEGAKQ